MKRPAFIARQSGNPHGPIGRLIAWIMARETADLNRRAVELLALEPADRVLEVGFGHGRTVARIAAEVPAGSVAGVDVSRSMTRVATRRNRAAVAAGRVRLWTGDAAALEAADGAFDKVLSVHTIYFWPRPELCLAELARATRSGGRLVLGFTPAASRRAASFPAEVYAFHGADQIDAMLAVAGFRVAAHERVGEAMLTVAERVTGE